jgi:hypothetical protein
MHEMPISLEIGFRQKQNFRQFSLFHQQMARHNCSLAHSCGRVGRFVEAKKSLEKLGRSDSGQPWQYAIRHELSLIKRDLQENSQEIDPNTEVDSNLNPPRRKVA